MKKYYFFILCVLWSLSLTGCETSKGLLRDTQSVLGSIAGIINAEKTIANVAK